MENKLIKQLKSVGFKFDDPMDDSYMILRSKKDASFVRYVPSKSWLLFFKSSSSKAHYSDYFNTFPQIIEAIKEHTGVDLTPKKSKREEIEELKTKVASFEDAIRSQNKAIEELNISKPLEVAKEIAKLALKLKEMELSKTFENGGVIGTAHEGESVLTDAMLNAKRDNLPLNFTASRFKAEIESISKPKYTQDLPFSFSTPNFKAALDSISEPKSTEEQEKKAFKVGDSVVVVGNYDDARHGDIGFVITTPSKYAAPEYYVEFHGMITWVHEDNLEHAPEEQEKEKALEFGSLVITLCDCDEVKAGEKVVVLKHYENGDIDAVTKEGVTCCYNDSEYKPL